MAAAVTQRRSAGRPAGRTQVRPAAARRQPDRQRRGTGREAARWPAEGAPRRLGAGAPTGAELVGAGLSWDVAVFLIVVLVAAGRGGILGGGGHGASTVLFGRLAFVVPVALLLVAAVTTVFERQALRRSYLGRWALLVFLFGLFLLVRGRAAAVRRSHGAGTFVRGRVRGRAGGLGEAFYVAVPRAGRARSAWPSSAGWPCWPASASPTGMTAAHWLGTKRARSRGERRRVTTAAERTALERGARRLGRPGSASGR